VEKPSATLQSFLVGAEDQGQRVDRWLAARLPETSRTHIQQAIAAGRVRVAGEAARSSLRLRAGQPVEIELIAAPPIAAEPEAIPLDILYEDEDLVAIHKPAGLIVHPGAGAQSGTVAGALLYRYGRLSTVGGATRPGIVHRLDKDTSGVLLVARNDPAHLQLAREFVDRQVKKTYLALLHGALEGDTGKISLSIARDLRRRTRMTTRRREGRAALTTWRMLARLGQGRDGFTLVEAELHTGRTHQLRVHFSAIGHPVAGDARYGAPRRVLVAGEAASPLGRLWLHAARVRLAHPRTGQALEIRAPLPPELVNWLAALGRPLGWERPEIDRVLHGYL